MKIKEFKAESKRLMDLMINSIYTNKEIFLREILSNASDAIDKLYYRSLTDRNIKIKREDLEIIITLDNKNNKIIISDNGCGMTKEELETNLGTIAKSGSKLFKEESKPKKEIDIIGQFGVGFYSAFMVSKKVEVISKPYGHSEAHKWKSEGIEGYSTEACNKENYGTDVILYLKDDTEEEKYNQYLDKHIIKNLIKKYSDYITYPIKIETEIINSLIPLWKREKNKIKQEEYNNFYCEKFFDYEQPLKNIHTSVEGLITFNALLYLPSHTPYNYYTKEYEKGLQLYSNGVLIMEKCPDLLPDYFSFIKGIVDSPDLSLNISRETLQQTKILKTISSNLEKKIKSMLEDLIKNDRKKYEQFFKNFGVQIKFGIYNNFGMNKDKLQDLLIFYSSKQKKLVTLKEYTEHCDSTQTNIYYACGETIDKLELLPQVEKLKEKELDILYCTDYIDEFVIKTINNYNDKLFINVCTDELNLDTEKEKEQLNRENQKYKELLKFMKDTISNVKDVRFTNKLKNHPVCLTTEGEITTEMEKIINAIPTEEKIKATTILEININHDITKKLKTLYKNNKEELKEYSKILYSQARLIEGLSIENPTEISNLICQLLSK